MKERIFICLALILLVSALLLTRGKERLISKGIQDEIAETIKWNIYEDDPFPGKDIRTVPAMKKSKRISYMHRTLKDKSIVLIAYESENRLKDIISFYKRELPENGWKIISGNSDFNQLLCTRNREGNYADSLLQLVVMPDGFEGRSIINFIIQEKR